MSETQAARLKEIRDVLLEARYAPAYNIGSPQALDHLLVHLVAVIEALIPDPFSELHQEHRKANDA